MRIAVSGSTGFIGSALVQRLQGAGHHIRRLVRRNRLNSPNDAPMGTLVLFDPNEQQIDRDGLENLDAVIHLAGEPIADGRWTEEKKQRILASRVVGTELLSSALAELRNPPRVLLSASAVGYYGDRDDDVLVEESMPGGGFLADVAREWEAATQSAAGRGIRVSHLRFGMVLGPEGGALGRMLPLFRWGLGGKLGDGRQYVSWISRPDCLRAIETLMTDDQASGAFNIVAPHPVTNAHFTRALGRTLRRPTAMDVPMFAVRLMFGEMADALLLASQRVEPRRLMERGFQFEQETIESAFRDLLRG
jgi:hypothetical protein